MPNGSSKKRVWILDQGQSRLGCEVSAEGDPMTCIINALYEYGYTILKWFLSKELRSPREKEDKMVGYC